MRLCAVSGENLNKIGLMSCLYIFIDGFPVARVVFRPLVYDNKFRQNQQNAERFSTQITLSIDLFERPVVIENQNLRDLRWIRLGFGRGDLPSL